MTRRPFIAGNWKLNLGPKAAAKLGAVLKTGLARRGAVDVAVFPTALSVPAVVPEVAGSGIEVGVQDVHETPQGAFTGCNAAAMARELGCTRTLVGHSERRQLFGETSAQTGAKVQAALAAGVLPVLCVGETLEQRQANQVESVLFEQLSQGLGTLQADQVATITLAYEPVWAIGTGVTATPQQAEATHAAIRGWLASHYPAWVASELRILYGGSVKPANAAQLLACPNIDGALVGGASLNARDFAAIVGAAG